MSTEFPECHENVLEPVVSHFGPVIRKALGPDCATPDDLEAWLAKATTDEKVNVLFRALVVLAPRGSLGMPDSDRERAAVRESFATAAKAAIATAVAAGTIEPRKP